MNLGESILSLKRYALSSFAFFIWWSDEEKIDLFLDQGSFEFFKNKGWHVRMKKYRRWGGIKEINDAYINPNIQEPPGPVVAVTLARLKLSQIFRFIKWGKPVEEQVRDHKGKSLALAAIRPLNTFCTFSVWKNEKEMINMVNGQNKSRDGESHKLAMIERNRRPFHLEFSTMRFTPTSEWGEWGGRSNHLNGSH